MEITESLSAMKQRKVRMKICDERDERGEKRPRKLLEQIVLDSEILEKDVQEEHVLLGSTVTRKNSS